MSFSPDLIIEDIMREKEKTESNRVWAAESAPYFFVVALGARYTPPQYCNLLLTPLPGKRRAQSVPSPHWICFSWHCCHWCGRLCHFPKCGAALLVLMFRCWLWAHKLQLSKHVDTTRWGKINKSTRGRRHLRCVYLCTAGEMLVTRIRGVFSFFFLCGEYFISTIHKSNASERFLFPTVGLNFRRSSASSIKSEQSRH